MTGHPSNTWQSIQEELKRRIVEREWQPGDQVPNESDLADEFGCARATVNRAMRQLAESGLLVRRRKAGTRVALNPVRHAKLEIPIIREEVESRGLEWHQAILEKGISPASDRLTRQYQLPKNCRLLHLRSVHFADRKPYVYETRWISLSAVPEVENEDFETVSANEWLVRNAPFTHGEILFSAAKMTSEEAEIMAVGAGDAAFVLERTTWIGDQAITAARMIYHPGYRKRSEL